MAVSFYIDPEFVEDEDVDEIKAELFEDIDSLTAIYPALGDKLKTLKSDVTNMEAAGKTMAQKGKTFNETTDKVNAEDFLKC